MNDLPTDWSYDEVAAFAMLYAASIDTEITEEEEELIRKRIDPVSFEVVKKAFEACSDSECINQILSYHDQYFDTEEARQRLLEDFRRVFEADHKYSVMERRMMHIFRQIL